MKKEKPWVACLVSLGCAKNTVDSELLLGRLAQAGFLIAENPADADICLVNTCGFIAPARTETAAVLEQISRQKKRGRPRALIALGCLVEKTAGTPEFEGFLATADARVGFKDYVRLPEICRAVLEEQPLARRAGPADWRAAFYDAPRLRTGGDQRAWLKISEGCSNACSFCSIPSIRGRQVSRPPESLLREARALAASGAREIALIAQDTTAYGRDLPGKPALAGLLRALSAGVDGELWFRLMYAHPKSLTDDVLDAMLADPRFCGYFDIPLQHISDPLLKTMRRGVTRRQTENLLRRIKERMPGVGLRSAFIVGFPGETEARFAELLEFIRQGHFLYAGVFTYSPEPGTPAAQRPDRIPEDVKSARRDALLDAQRTATRRQLEEYVGREIDVLVESEDLLPPGSAAGTLFARARFQAPEVDGVVFLKKFRSRPAPGTLLRARVTASDDYDLTAQPG